GWRSMTALPSLRAWLGALLTLIVISAVAAASSVVVTSSPATAATPPAPTGLPAGLERMARYVPQRSCEPTNKPGTVRFAALLRSTYPGPGTGMGRTCLGSTSEHHDGRAIDWMTNVRNPKQRAMANAAITWLFAKDARGNPYANARRLGVMYLIWNNRIWGAYNAQKGWRPYKNCAKRPEKRWDGTCHRNHVHISLSWEGAMGRTSFWSKRVVGVDYGPCRPADLNWAASRTTPNPRPCPRHPRVQSPRGASSTLKTLTAYSGQVYTIGSRGSGVRAVQKVLKVSPRSGYYGPVTTAAMKKWQQAHRLKATGHVDHSTWRALLKDQAPR
ncbi:MAG: peptidoglycan-binding domain-containing protein, partial [Actinomycetes bacterium]